MLMNSVGFLYRSQSNGALAGRYLNSVLILQQFILLCQDSLQRSVYCTSVINVSTYQKQIWANSGVEISYDP
jgi:hypothetical protein